MLRQEREERRKARLLQVREQERSFAKAVRDNVKTKKQEERKAMAEHLQAVLAASQEAELRELEAHYRARQRQIGQGHREAQHVTEVNSSGSCEKKCEIHVRQARHADASVNTQWWCLQMMTAKKINCV